jgi:hypothetical protein
MGPSGRSVAVRSGRPARLTGPASPVRAFPSQDFAERCRPRPPRRALPFSRRRTARRSVLTVLPWPVKVMEQWLGSCRAVFGTAARSDALWPGERLPRPDMGAPEGRFAAYRMHRGCRRS